MKNKNIVIGWEGLIDEKLPKLKILSDNINSVNWVFELLGWKHDRRAHRNR